MLENFQEGLGIRVWTSVCAKVQQGITEMKVNYFPIAIFFLASVLFLNVTFSSSPGEFSYWDIFFILLALLVVLLLQSLIFVAFRNREAIAKLLLSSFLSLNMVALYLGLSTDFVTLRPWQQVFAILAIIWIFFSMLSITESRSLAKKITIASLLVANFLLVSLSVSDRTAKSSGISQIAPPLFNLEFKRTPNVYIISFDSIAPELIVAKHLDLPEQPYHTVVRNNFTVLPNLFSTGWSTKNSLNSVLAFDSEYYKKLSLAGANHKLIAGIEKSPFFEQFKNNGYQITVFYDDGHFGPSKGAFIDNYKTNSKFSACKFVDGPFRRLIFFGMCMGKVQRFADSIVSNIVLNKTEFALKVIDEAIASDGPQVVFGHIYLPGHVGGDFSYSDSNKLTAYKKFYQERSIRASNAIMSIIAKLEQNDPDAVFLIYGDHGSRLFGGSGADLSGDSQWKNSQIFLDNYAVFGGVYPKTFCPERLHDRSNIDYNTTVSVAEDIILCLSGIESATKTRKWAAPFDLDASQERNQYETYLYE